MSARIFGLAALTAVVGATSVAHAAPSFPKGALIVDDDGADCPRAQFDSIQDAVDAAQPGGVVGVCPGLYEESVRVEKTLAILGPKRGKDARKRSLSSSAEAVVTSDRPFLLLADRVVLDGFTIITDLGVDSPEGSGVLTGFEYSGYVIQNNVVDADGVTAIFPGTSGELRSHIRRNHLYNRFGVATSGDEPFAPAVNVHIVDNLFEYSTLLLASGEDDGVLVARNTFIEGGIEGGGIVIRGGSAMLVRGNKVYDPDGPAIEVGETQEVTIERNILRDGAEEGILVHDATVRIVDNSVEGMNAAAVRLVEAGGTLVRENELEDSAAGVIIEQTSGARVERNSIEDNAGAGVSIDGSGAGNVVKDNEVRGNGEPADCVDTSQGGGTSGTANAWSGNEGSDAEPEGLCED